MAERTRELRRLIWVLVAGIATAFILTAFFVWEFGPSGRYSTNAVLLEPDVLTQLNYNDYNPITGGSDRYVFDQLTFTDADFKNKKGVDIHTYEKLYRLINGDKSITVPGEEVDRLFKEVTPATLTVEVRTESSAAWQKDTKIFQEIQFAPQGDYYRIELHEANKGTHWVYFHHPDILAKIKEIQTR